ncbi:MAG: tryptophan synthase subunit alpha [Gammaproteobacteria bacterium]|nr:tryptophan synthase subunit alpha [Gammaproteobacteria bacterium]
MSRLQRRFERLRAQGRKGLVAYVTAGDPAPQETVALMHAMAGAGADVIELGVPFSDPMADGPVIQAAFERALAHGTSLRRVLELVGEFRGEDAETPVVLMGYLNPIEAMGYRAFAEAAARAGVDGVLTVDLPPEEAEPWLPVAEAQGLDPVFLVAPTSTPERICRLCAASRGFVYYVSLKGVTGAAHLDAAGIAERVDAVRAVSTLPVGVGFGIRDAPSAAAVAASADAVIVGSALVSRIAEHAEHPQRMRSAVAELMAGLRAAIDGVARGAAARRA